MNINRDILNIIDDIACIIDKNHTIIDINNYGLELLKKKRNEVIGTKCHKTFHNSDKPQSFCPLSKSLKTGKAASTEHYEELNEKHFSIKTSPIFNEKGELTHFIHIMCDISLLKEKENELEDANEEYTSVNQKLKKLNVNYELLNNYSSDAIAMYDENMKPIYISESTINHIGYNPKELMQVNGFDLIHPEDKNRLLTEIGNYRKNNITNYSTTYRVKHKKGHYFWNESVTHILNDAKTGKTITIVNNRNINDRKKAEEALIESKNNYRLLVENINDLVCEIDEAGRFTYLNKQYDHILGYKPEELIGQKAISLIHPDDLQASLKKYEILKNEEKQRIDIWRFRHKNGSYRIIESKGAVYEVDKKQKRTVVISRDITENVQAQKELEQSEKIKSLVLKSTQELFAYYDTNLKTLWANNAAAESVGLTPEEMNTRHCYELWHKRNTPCENCPLIKVKKTKKPHEAEIRTPDNKYWQIRGYPVLNKNGELAGLIEFGQDITKRKKYEIELKKAKELSEINELKYKTIFEGAPIGIFRSTLEGKFIEVNPALAKMLGYNKQQEVIDDIYDIASQIYVEGSKRNSIVDNTDKTKIDKYDNVYKRKNGELFNANLFLRKVTDENGNVLLEGIVEETTERKKYEHKLKEALKKAEESNRLKAEFLNNMSHEVRTPMNGIMGFAQMLNRPSIKPEKKAYYTRIIQENSKQLLKIIDDILEISRLETQQVKVYQETFYLNRLIEKIYTTYATEVQPGVTLNIKKRIPDAKSMITTDKSKLIKILIVLVENAIKFTHKGYIEIGCQLKQNKIELYVKDTGIGINPENKKLIFERFSHEDITIASEKGGLGIGLSIAKENTELIGGEITLKSQKGKGSTFTVTLPFTPIESSDHKDCRKSDQIPTTKIKKNHTHTILIVEDDEINFLYMEALLNEEIEGNFNIIHVKNGKNAIAACKENKNIELVLMDIKMPDMNGYEATKTIKSFRPALPIIAQTAFSSIYEKNTASDAGCDEFISKPIVRENLSVLLHKFLKQE